MTREEARERARAVWSVADITDLILAVERETAQHIAWRCEHADTPVYAYDMGPYIRRMYGPASPSEGR